MNEVLADLYADTGDKRWLDLSYRFEHEAVLDPLKRGEDPLNGLHGNTQVPKLIGSAARYAYAGDHADLAAATTFWDRVVNHHTFATGGHGKDEYFREPDRLATIVEGRTAETCNVYNMLKLTRKLFAIQPDVRYAEFHERALFNHILGSIDPSDGATCYMVPVGRGVRREYADMQRSFTCCVGTGHGEPRAARPRHLLRSEPFVARGGIGCGSISMRHQSRAWDARRRHAHDGHVVPGGRPATLIAESQRRERSRCRSAGRRGPAMASRFASTASAPCSRARRRARTSISRARGTRGDTVTLALPKTLRLGSAARQPDARGGPVGTARARRRSRDRSRDRPRTAMATGRRPRRLRRRCW